MQTCVIKLTKASEKYGNLNIRLCGKDFFPHDVFGSHSKRSGLGVPITLKVEGLPEPIKTDIPTDKTGRPRWLFRERKWVKQFLKLHSLVRGDEVVVHRLNQRTYNIGPARLRQQLDLFEDNWRPVLFAHRLAEKYIEGTAPERRKERGQYFTPPEVAHFMAGLAETNGRSTVKILDPGAGAGILSCAVCEELAQKQGVNEIELDTYEMDLRLVGILDRVLTHLAAWLQQRSIHLKSRVIAEDFVLAGDKLREEGHLRPYDIVISNPPYKKISGDDPRSRIAAEAVCGQPNLYALFMLTSAKLLSRSGSMVFITPRSYMAGCYFNAFRRAFFEAVHPVRVHLFDSRKDLFSDQGVLQENVILKARKGTRPTTIVISHSRNSVDLNRPTVNRVPLSYALDSKRTGMILRLPLDECDDAVIELVDSWSATLSDFGLDISTGPVVPFRAKEFIVADALPRRRKLVPLLWMRNVQPMCIVWPCDCPRNRDAANQYIVSDRETLDRNLLVPNGNMVLLRRFSAKEQKRRLTAAPLLADSLEFEYVGLENHLNYIHKVRSSMSRHEAMGLAALLNSSLMDGYFRICNGNTQVSATEIRAMPMPPLDVLIRLGRMVDEYPLCDSLEEIDRFVCKVIKPARKNNKLFERVVS